MKSLENLLEWHFVSLYCIYLKLKHLIFAFVFKSEICIMIHFWELLPVRSKVFINSLS
jgi:hypothetical protein